MRRIIKFATTLFLLLQFSMPGRAEEDNAAFRNKLSLLLTNIEKSISILRNQMHESQHAAFLPDLNFELANLLAQKSTTLYYIQMERGKMAGDDSGLEGSKAQPVIAAQKEANLVLNQILDDFPQYAKRSEVLYSLAIGYNAIDESGPFLKTVTRLKKDYPGSTESIRASILLGQYYLNKGMFDEAIEQWVAIAQSDKKSIENNQARYYMGVALTRKNKDKDALVYLEQVAKSDEINAEKQDTEVSLDKRTASSDLRREALLESIIPFTNVHGTKVDSIKYYSTLAPNESVFQEVLEKLAFRYAFLKKYDESIRLLRMLSQRMRDAQKILVIYADVLRLIPLESRLDISPDEMRYVLERLNYWQSYYQPDNALREKVSSYFEVQLRELGTRAHSEARKEGQNSAMYARAEEYYKIYLAYFAPSATAAKVAANLGDLYIQRKDYLNCGNYYLDAYAGTFGPPVDKKSLIQNALFCLDKKTEGSFYQQTRKRGLLVRAIENYKIEEPRQASNPPIQLAYARAIYENGERDRGTELLKKFIGDYPKSREAAVAGEILLDHYNKTENYGGLAKTTQFLQSVGLADTSFIKRVSEIQKQATQKLLDEKVKTFNEYDDFSQGRSYLQAALSSDDSAMRGAALNEALAKSRAEGDFTTFSRAAVFMSSNEKDPKKRATILYSLAREQQNLAYYPEATNTYLSILEISDADEKTQRSAFEEATNVALLAKDTRLLGQLAAKPQWRLLGGGTRKRVTEFMTDVLVSPIELSGNLSAILAEDVDKESALPAFIKAGPKVPGRIQDRLKSSLESFCSRGRQRPPCRWNAFVEIEPSYASLRKDLLEGSRSPNGIEGNATRFQKFWVRYQELQGSRDPDLEAAIALRLQWLFTNFAKYLDEIGKANPELKDVLAAKARESQQVAEKYHKGCLQLAASAAQFSPAGKQCNAAVEPQGTSVYTWSKQQELKGLAAYSSTGGELEGPRKALFVKPSNGQALLNLSYAYLKAGAPHHAAASASTGLFAQKDLADSFRVVLGCAAADLGLYQEAYFHLSKGADFQGLKNACLAKIKRGGQ